MSAANADGAPQYPYEFSSKINTLPYAHWGSENATAKESFENGVIAPRRVANERAIQAAMQSGNIFKGNIDIPIIDFQTNKDDRGNIPGKIEAFKLRSRLKRFGKADNQIILIMQTVKKFDDERMKQFEQFLLPVIAGLENWIVNIKNHKAISLVASKPISLQDACLINNEQKGIYESYKGAHVWDGVLEPKQDVGVCARHFVFYSNPRMMSGEDIATDKLKCDLIPIEKFIGNQGYGDVQMNNEDIVNLKKKIPTGVCDTI